MHTLLQYFRPKNKTTIRTDLQKQDKIWTHFALIFPPFVGAQIKYCTAQGKVTRKFKVKKKTTNTSYTIKKYAFMATMIYTINDGSFIYFNRECNDSNLKNLGNKKNENIFDKRIHAKEKDS